MQRSNKDCQEKQADYLIRRKSQTQAGQRKKKKKKKSFQTSIPAALTKTIFYN